MKRIWIAIVLLVLVLIGCGYNEEELKVYEGNLERIESEIGAYTTDVTLESIEETKTCRANKYTMDLKLDVENKNLSGTVIIDLVNETQDNLEWICLRNYAVSILEDKGISTIQKVRNLNTGENLELKVDEEDASIVYVKLDDLLEQNETISLFVTFSTDVPKKDYRFGYHEEGDNRSFLLTYCFPVVAMYENGEWAEYPYISHAESNYHTATDYEVTIEVPEEYLVVASGEEETVGNTTTIKAEKIRDMAIVVSNYMKVETISTQKIDINLYSLEYENTKGYNEISLLAGKDSVDLYTELIGPYAYKELDIVQCFYSSAMEYPGLVMIGFPDLKSPEEIDDDASYGHVCSQIAHEVAHQWFYAAVGNDSYMEPWLDESFAEYCEDILYVYSGCESVQKAAKSDMERLFSSSNWGCQTEEDLEEWMQIQMQQGMDEDGTLIINHSYEAYRDEENSYSEHVYDGGAMFLYELQNAMGDGAFFHMLQSYYEASYMKESTTEDFIAAVKSYDSSEEVEEIINKYIE